ncbi:structural cement protein Gp24 [Megasphaera sueciensis]|uniref:structural cement protein Gp24 n=1 Tax=Megasphaera sueciensis TaxID=349094 RepID=UPI003D08EC7B
MPGSVIGITLPYGYPGQISRHGDEISRTRPVDAASGNIMFGGPVIQNSTGTVTAFGATNVASDFAGVAMRKVKSAKVYPYQNYGYYSANEPCDILLRGGVSVKCAWGTPSVGSTVYIRTAVVNGTSPSGAAIGDFGASNESGNCIALTNAKWSSDIDARNVAELTILNRQGV